VGSGSDAEGSNLLMLARTARENVSAGTALHAGTRAKMASKARSFRLSGDLQESKSSWTPPRLATQADISPRTRHIRFTPESGHLRRMSAKGQKRKLRTWALAVDAPT
jgi:hypothetical protein